MSWIQAGKDGTRYELYFGMENRYGTGHTRITIDKRTTASSKCRGFCLYERHPGFLTDWDMSRHHCTERDCRFFLPKPKRINTIRRLK